MDFKITMDIIFNLDICVWRSKTELGLGQYVAKVTIATKLYKTVEMV